jgi:hypothetical protein
VESNSVKGKAEGRRQKAEVRSQRAESRNQKLPLSPPVLYRKNTEREFGERAG